MNNEHLFSCIILAGGKSSRMGQDKAFLDFYGKSFIRVIAEKLSRKCNQLIISANKEEDIYRRELKGIDFDVVKDINPYDGPLNAVVSTLPLIKNEFVFIATCDTPFLNENLIDFYLSVIDGFDAVIPVVDEKFQTLNTLYTQKAILIAKDIYKTKKSLLSWIENLNYLKLPENKIRLIDEKLLTYKSINTKEDYLKLLSKEPKSNSTVD